MTMKRVWAIGMSVAVLSVATTAAAADDDSSTKSSVSVGTKGAAATTESKDDPNPDHEKVVGHFGLTYFGLSQIPIAGAAGQNVTRSNVNAPVIGGRYWLQRNFGIDVGLGLGFSSSSTEVVNGGNTTTTDQPSVFGLALHGGVPLALAHGKHYSFLAIPELNLGFASSSQKNPTQPNQPVIPDTDFSGFLFDIGGRVGAEIYFGFIGIPELALNASVGLRFRRESWKVKQGDNFSASQSVTGLGTTVEAAPWAIFTNNISAIYYF